MFNTYAHLQLQASDNWHSFHLLNEKYKTIHASIHFHLDSDVAYSPLKSPFGSFECTDGIAVTELYGFIEAVVSHLKELGAKRIVIKDPPALYDNTRAALVHTFLFNQGFEVIDAEVGATINVSASLESKLDEWERRKLRQANNAGLTFRKLPIEELSEIYLFILACRKQKGHSLSMALGDLKRSVQTFQDEFQLFGIFSQEKLAAASISIRVKQNILYNFYSAHGSEFDSVSPAVLLMAELYKYCEEQEIALLDLGTSAVQGKPNFGLLDFKLRMGAMPSPKLTFAKNL